MCVPELNIQHGARTTDNITIFAAELTAIKLALMWVMNTLDEDVSIFSDSYSSLQAITSGKTICRPNLLLDIIILVSLLTSDLYGYHSMDWSEDGPNKEH